MIDSRSMLLLTAALAICSSPLFADGFELQDAYRSARRNHWRGNEFSLHYSANDTDWLSYGAYFSNSSWRIDQEKRGQVKEFGPEFRLNQNLDPFLVYAGFQYALLSDGSYRLDQHDVGAKIRGPRLSLGALYPIESIGLILSFGLTKGWERIYSYADEHRSGDFGSHSFFVGLSL